MADEKNENQIQDSITYEDADYALNIVKTICTETGPGLPGTAQERRRASIIAKELTSQLGPENVIIEDYTLAPDAFLGSLPVSAVGIFISILLNYIATKISGTASWIASCAALIISIASVSIVFFEFVLYKELIDPFFKKKQSVNVIGTLRKPGTDKVNKLLILSGHHDSALENTWIALLRYGFYITIPIIYIGYFGMIVLGFIQFTGILLDNTRIIYAGTVQNSILLFPVILSIIFAFFFNRGRKNGGIVPGAADNLSASAAIVALCKFLVKHPSYIPEDTEIRFISFGGEEAGLRGSRCYVKKHLEELKRLDVRVLNFEIIADPEIVILTSDVSNVKNSPEMVKSIESAAIRAGVPFKVKPYPFGGGGSDAGSFSQAGLKALTLLPFKTPQQIVAFYHQKSDTPEILRAEPLMNVLKLSFEWVRNGGA